MNQADDMLRRVSPEGRDRARREREARTRRTASVVVMCLLWAILLASAAFALSLTGVTLPAKLFPLLVVLFVAGSGYIAYRARIRPVAATSLREVPLALLPGRTAEWLEGQRAALPPPAQTLGDTLGRKLAELGPQLQGVEAQGAGAAAIRKLVAHELPELVERYRRLPQGSLAADEAATRLVGGLEIVDAEVTRLSNDLASGSFNALATQARYLELKYDDSAPSF